MLTWGEQIEIELALEEHILNLENQKKDIEKALEAEDPNYSKHSLENVNFYLESAKTALTKIKSMEKADGLK